MGVYLGHKGWHRKRKRDPLRPEVRGLSQRRALADNFKCLVLDCDGVLWRGSEAIPGSSEAVQALQRSGKQLAFVTNASARTRAAVADRISAKLGTAVPASDVVTSGSVAAAAVAARANPTAFVIGADGLHEEMRLAGVSVVEPVLPMPFDEAAFRALARTLPPVGAVVVGHDEAFSYGKLALASLLLQQGGEACTLIGTNPDVANRDVDGYLVPEAGTLIAAVEAASGREATVVGKPSPEVICQLIAKHGLEAEEVLMVGDRLDTDIRFGLAARARTCLVLTGVHTRIEAEALPTSERPNYVKDCLLDIVAG